MSNKLEAKIENEMKKKNKQKTNVRTNLNLCLSFSHSRNWLRRSAGAKQYDIVLVRA